MGLGAIRDANGGEPDVVISLAGALEFTARLAQQSEEFRGEAAAH